MDETPVPVETLDDVAEDQQPWQEPDQGTSPDEYVAPVDLDGDGAHDAVLGYLTQVGQFALLDADADGTAEYVEVDTDGDGLVDVTVEQRGDEWFIRLDSDLDGAVDAEFPMTFAELQEQVPDLWALLTGDPGGLADDGPVDDGAAWVPEVVDGAIVGDPFAYSDLWFQQAFDGSCLPAAVAQIYSLYTGELVTDQEFVEIANQHGGWIVGPDGVPGMAPETAVALLETVGIDASLQTSDLDGLSLALEQGYSVMVAVDSGEIWYGEEAEDDTMDHALLVAGIDVDGGVVWLSDTGVAEGNMLSVPLDVFLDSWQDSGNTMVVTELTVEEHRGGPVEVPAEVPAGEPPLAPVPDGDVTQVPGDVTQVPPTGQLPELDPTTALADVLEQDRSGLDEVVTRLVSTPWIVLPVALAGAHLIRRAAG